MSLVSVILSTYNDDGFVHKAIESILKQSYKNFEFLILDDHSIDKTINRIEKYSSDQRIRFFQNNENKGLPTNLNRLIGLSKGEIIIRMDADDIAATNRIERIVEEFDKDLELLLIGSDCIEIDENDKEIFYKKMPTTRQEIITMIFKRNPFVHPSVAFRKEFFDIVGFYNEAYRKFQDIELWAKAIVSNVKMKNINEPLLYFRVTNETRKKRSSWHAMKNEMQVSWFLVRKLYAYHRIPEAIFAKLGLRIIQKYMPSQFSEYLYKKLR